jgi:anti-sigma regulatory factor (Ser/Thr protein kinase)
MQAAASLLIPNDLNELTRVGEWVNAWAQQQTIPEHTAQQLDLCAAEAVTNVMTHGFADSHAHEIALRLALHGEAVVLEIEDDGVAFDPTLADPPPQNATMESDEVGGWGIRIVRRLSDELRYCRVGERNCLTLVFKSRPSVAA